MQWREFIRCVDVGTSDDGAERYSLDDLTLQDVSASPKIGNTLRENLAIFLPAEEIKRIRQIAETEPEILEMVRDSDTNSTRESEGIGKKVRSCNCRTCKAKKDKED